MTSPQTFKPDKAMFDKMYRGEPSVEGAPAPTVVPWDIGQVQPRLAELEALGVITGEVLDIGCGLGDNAIFLASKGHSVTALDGSPTAIERAKARAEKANATVTFDVADATELAGYENRFDTVVDSALYHCLDDGGRLAYAKALHRATRSGARLFMYCFGPGDVNGIDAPMASVPEDNIRDTLTAAGWEITFLGPTTYAGNAKGLGGGPLPTEVEEQIGPEAAELLRSRTKRYEAILPFVSGPIQMPFTVVHARRLD